MRLLLVALLLLGAAADKPSPAGPQKGAPAHPAPRKKKHNLPPPSHPPAEAPRSEKTKTAMA